MSSCLSTDFQQSSIDCCIPVPMQPSTAIFPQTYTGHESDDNFLGGALRQYLEGLRDAEDVQAYVEKNPIGEPSITAASPLWQVYSGLIGAGQPESVNREANVASNSTLVGDDIIAHESSKKSRRSSPVCQLEEIYPDEKWSYSPILRFSDLEDYIKNSRNPKIKWVAVGVPAYCTLHSLLISAKSGTVGLLLRK
jgi:hypothetical protein